MLRKLTDLWPNMLRPNREDGSEEEESLLAGQQDQPDDDQGGHLDEDHLLEVYRHLYWTRLMVIDGYEAQQERKWPMGPDVYEECEAVDSLPAVDLDGWSPLFEPTEFTHQHQLLLVEQPKGPPEPSCMC